MIEVSVCITLGYGLSMYSESANMIQMIKRSMYYDNSMLEQHVCTTTY